MPTIEIVIYIPHDMADFITYCKEGRPVGLGAYKVDKYGRNITGVIRWLLGRGVREAHFFNSVSGDAVNLFAATIERTENYDVPWMEDVPGFEEMVSTEGFLGTTSEFAPIYDLLAAVKTNTELDQAFIDRRNGLDTILMKMEENPNAIPSVGKLTLMAALRGDAGSNPAEVFAKVREKFPGELVTDSEADKIRH